MTDQITQIAALTQIIRDQATLLASVQNYLIVQADVLNTLLESNEKVRSRYDQHVIDIIKMQRKLQGEKDDEPVVQLDNGSSE